VFDWGAIRQLKNQGYSLDPLKCGSASLKAGNDIDMESRIYVKIPQMLKKGLISIEDIDSAVKNVLRLKFRLGLFENPYTEIISGNRYLKKEYREIAEQLAIESAVLLKNDDILPLEQPSKIYLAGNLLVDNEALLGSWLAHGNTNDVVSIESGFKRFIPNRSKLVDDPHKADFIILCLGETKKMSGENGSRSTLQLHNAHKVEEFSKYKKPLILVVGSGRPISYQTLEPKVDAIVHICQPLRSDVYCNKLELVQQFEEMS
jgi:beta-glucosidase